MSARRRSTAAARRQPAAAPAAKAPKPSPDARRAADRLRRLMIALPILGDEAWHDLPDLARRVGADEAVVLEDLRSLQERVDDVAGFIEGIRLFLEATRVRVETTLFRRPMGLSPAELRAVDLGLAMLRQERPPEEHPAIERARACLGRLGGAAKPAPVAHAADWGTIGDARHLATVQRGLLERRVVQLDYRSAAADAPTSRRVHPYRLLFGSGHWFLVGWCERSAAIRVFRVDRIARAALAAEGFEMPATIDLDALLSSHHVFVNGGTTETLIVRYGPRIARWIAEREQGTERPDGSLEVTWPLADVSWAVRHVLQYGPDAEVVSPPAVRARVREVLAELAGTG